MKKPKSPHLKKGKNNETLVRNRLKKKGWQILSKNTKHLGIEIDLIAQKKNRTVVFEIKSLNQEAHLEKILSLKQKQRLQSAVNSLAEDFPKGLELILVTVNRKKEISFFPIT